MRTSDSPTSEGTMDSGTVKPSEDATLTKTAYVCSEMVDEPGTIFPGPSFWTSGSCQSLTSILQCQVLHAHFLNVPPLNNCCYRTTAKQRKQSEVCKHIKLGIRRPDQPSKWHTVSSACVNVWVFLISL